MDADDDDDNDEDNNNKKKIDTSFTCVSGIVPDKILVSSCRGKVYMETFTMKTHLN